MRDIAWRLQTFDALPSTSTYCWQMAEVGALEGLAILARTQTSGRGTKGRTWYAPTGNLSFSFLLRPENVVSLVATMPFLVAVAVYDAIKAWTPEADLILKWPNDLLLEGHKVSGILIEANTDSSGWIVVGVGVNLCEAPAIDNRKIAALSKVGIAPEPEILAKRILEQVQLGLDRLTEFGRSQVHAAWLERAHPIGARLALTVGGAYIEGAFSGLGPEAQLLLRTDDGQVHAFVAGETKLTIRDDDASRH